MSSPVAFCRYFTLQIPPFAASWHNFLGLRFSPQLNYKMTGIVLLISVTLLLCSKFIDMNSAEIKTYLPSPVQRLPLKVKVMAPFFSSLNWGIILDNRPYLEGVGINEATQGRVT